MPCRDPRDTHIDREDLDHLEEAARLLCEIARDGLHRSTPLSPRVQAWTRRHLAQDFRRARWYGNKLERDAALGYLAKLYPSAGDPSTTMRAFFCSHCAWTLRPWLPTNAAVANQCPHCRSPLMWVSAAPDALDQIFEYL